jgi:hypothetical protein
MFKEIKTPEQVQQELVQQEQERINNESREYLKSTDWYVIRQQETGVAIPQDILDARQTARDATKQVDVAETVEELKGIHVN